MEFIVLICAGILPFPFLLITYLFVYQFYEINKFGVRSVGKVIDYKLISNRTGDTSVFYNKRVGEDGKIKSMDIANDHNTTAAPIIEFQYEGKMHTFESKLSETKLYLKYPIGSEIPITINTKDLQRSVYGSPASPSKIIILLIAVILPVGFAALCWYYIVMQLIS
jgi:hypothetical protein